MLQLLNIPLQNTANVLYVTTMIYFREEQYYATIFSKYNYIVMIMLPLTLKKSCAHMNISFSVPFPIRKCPSSYSLNCKFIRNFQILIKLFMQTSDLNVSFNFKLFFRSNEKLQI